MMLFALTASAAGIKQLIDGLTKPSSPQPAPQPAPQPPKASTGK